VSDKPNLGGGKASVLMSLRDRIRVARIPDGIIIPWPEWRSDKELALARVLALDHAGSLAIRSSRPDEDRDVQDAGRYLTLLSVPAHVRDLSESIERVFESYARVRDSDQVLVQPQVLDIQHALVASTRGAWGSAYHTISVSDGAAPDAITRGDSPAEIWHVHPDGCDANLPKPVARALATLRELCSIFEHIPFEAELVEDSRCLWLLQVRALPGDRRVSLPTGSLERATTQLAGIREQGAPLLGLMPDWNTAELLGTHPRPLALSLFQSLIGESNWWQARAALGYARPYSECLVRPVAGRPYVDVRASFESLCAAALPATIRSRLVNAWLDRLRSRPNLHDQVEFAIVLSGIEFDMESRLQELDCDVTGTDLHAALLRITMDALDRNGLATAIRSFSSILGASPTIAGPLGERLSTLASGVARSFATVARCDFLAQALWHSAARREAIDPARCLAMLADGSNTVGRNRIADRAGRPSQFDIRSAVSGPSTDDKPNLPQPTFQLNRRESVAVTTLLREHSLPWSVDQLVDLARLAARARELGKQALAALLGDWLAGARQFGEQRNLDVETLSWLSWQQMVDTTASPADIEDQAERARRRYESEAPLKMPLLLANEEDLRVIRTPPATGHFHGSGVVEGPLAVLDAQSRRGELRPDSIVAIASADPGFEWIFSRRPKALLTAFGGPHSHMALRCADAQCCFVLGLGNERFERLANGTYLRIDFDQAYVHVLCDRVSQSCAKAN
jgi:hypothetical protein